MTPTVVRCQRSQTDKNAARTLQFHRSMKRSLVIYSLLLTCFFGSCLSCMFVYEDEEHEFLQLTNTHVNNSVLFLSHGGVCDVAVLAVGGGGQGKLGGGGSGYIKYYRQHLDADMELIVRVGGPWQRTTVDLLNTDGRRHDLLIAEAGETGFPEQGGNGYSGGGGWDVIRDDDACQGGSDGGAGRGDLAGNGTREDVSSYQMKHFILSPGTGGESFHNGFYFGGGGGGVLVNGEGPEPDPYNAPYQGEGYGGGGNEAHCCEDGSLPGVVLLEVYSKI